MVIVFARIPRLGAVKRRLAAGVGDRAALRFHVATLDRLTRALARDRRFRSCVAVTPRAGGWVGDKRLGRLPQGHGDLGTRMDAALRRFPRRPAAIIGCDIPDAGPDDLAAAFWALGRADAAFGPAEDGGYWLVALSPRRPARPFANVRWSSEHALSDTLANFRGRRVAMLRTLRDVDTADDLTRATASPRSPPPARRCGPR